MDEAITQDKTAYFSAGKEISLPIPKQLDQVLEKTDRTFRVKPEPKPNNYKHSDGAPFSGADADNVIHGEITQAFFGGIEIVCMRVRITSDRTVELFTPWSGRRFQIVNTNGNWLMPEAKRALRSYLRTPLRWLIMRELGLR